ncbi:hypothetical protein R83H12_00243 [Fibrobacteria bacterium R8-3-H12]
MTIEDQQNTKQKGYSEAMRYIANAKGYLQKAGMDGNLYKDEKYVRSASGTAYSGVLVALEALAKIKGIPNPKKGRRSVDFYRDILSYNEKFQKYFDVVYKNLHLSGYYDGTLSSGTIKDGFKYAKELINLVKPEAP